MQPQEKVKKITNIIEQLNIILDQLIDLNTDVDREFVDRILINKLQCFIVSNDVYTVCLTKWRNELLHRTQRELKELQS